MTSVAAPPSRYTPSWITSTHTTARSPPTHVYTTVTMPIARMPSGMFQPVTIASGMAVAKTRTQSARARVNRNTPEATRREAGDRDDRQGRGLGRDDRQHDGPPRQPVAAEEIVGRVALATREQQP